MGLRTLGVFLIVGGEECTHIKQGFLRLKPGKLANCEWQWLSRPTFMECKLLFVHEMTGSRNNNGFSNHSRPTTKSADTQIIVRDNHDMIPEILRGMNVT